jgi:hypothetical protein
MQYSWPKALDIVKQFAQNRTKILGAYPAETIDYMRYFASHLHNTDTFHPCDSERELTRVLNDMPKYCNYRSVDAYWKWKHHIYLLGGACWDVITEIDQLTQEWFNDRWNHPPGYVKPLSIEFIGDADFECEKLARQLVNQLRKP